MCIYIQTTLSHCPTITEHGKQSTETQKQRACSTRAETRLALHARLAREPLLSLFAHAQCCDATSGISLADSHVTASPQHAEDSFLPLATQNVFLRNLLYN